MQVAAQYPTTGNKQRLGYQTTGDGLVFRGSGSPAYTPTSMNNAWMFLDTTANDLYAYISGSWQLIGGGGAAFDGHVDSLVFNTTVSVVDSTGKMYYDAGNETISVGIDGGVVYQMGQELFYPLVINKSGAAILNGQLVMVDTLTLVTGDHVRVIPARNGANYPSSYIMGVATADIPNDSLGLVTFFGYVREVKHADIAETGRTLDAGDILYPSAVNPGKYTDVAPATPAHKSTIALVVRKPSDNNMTLLVRPWLAPKLANLSDVNTSSVGGLSVLRYNSTTGVWDASATPGIVAADTASMLSPYLRKVDTLSLSNRINLKLNISDTTAMLAPYTRGNSAAGRVAYWSGTRDLTGSANLTWTEANKTLGINTTTTSGANLIIKNTQEPTRTTVVANQTFGADTTNWTRGSGWTFNGTQAVATAATGALTYTPALTITSGNGYEVTYTLSNYTAGTLTVSYGDNTYILPTYNVTNNKVLLLPTTAAGGFRFTTSTFTGNLDNISVVEVSNPAPILIAGQNDNSATLYNPIRMPSESTIGFGGGGAYTTGVGNIFFGQNAGRLNTTGLYNVFIGTESGAKNTTASSNNFFGFYAGSANTIGGANNFFGFYAGTANTAGIYNNFFGSEAGRNNTIGSGNNFFGYQAGFVNTIASSNNFFGYQAGFANTTGGTNNFFGDRAGFSNISGYRNNFFGFQAGFGNTTGYQNGFYGYNAGYSNTTGFNNTFIGTTSAFSNTSGSSNVVIGDIAGYSFRTGSNNIAIGRYAFGNITLADSLSGANNVGIGYYAGANIKASASGNVIIGNQVNLPVADGSNQLVLSNLIFGINANATGVNYPANGRVGIRQNTPAYVFDINSTDAIRFPIGTTAQRPTGATGVVRYNSDSTKLEFHNGISWSGLQSTIANPVTGTGTAGQVSYWSGTGAQAGSNSFLWSDNFLKLNYSEAVSQNFAMGRISFGDNDFIRQFGNYSTNATNLYFSKKISGSETNLLRLLTDGTVKVGAATKNTYLVGDTYISSAETAVGTTNAILKVSSGSGNNSNISLDAIISYYNYNHGIILNASNTGVLNSNQLVVHPQNRIGVKQASPSYTLDINATDAIRLPVGTTAQQPTGAAGIVRYNSTNTALEYHNGTAWKTVANTDNTVQTFNFSINIYNASDSVKNITSPANFFLVPANLNGYCIDSYQVKALSGTGTADIQLAKNGTGGNVQAISGTTAYNKDTNVTLATGDVIQGQVFNLSAGATLVGLGLTIEIKATCN